MVVDRAAINHALSKAIAYKNVGKDEIAETWAIEVVRLLECAEILGEDACSER